MEKLSLYNKKRNFVNTPEPIGNAESESSGGKNRSNKLNFALQHHMARREHFDLRLEWEGTLVSWAIPKGPSFDTRDKRLAVKVEDHPLDYRTFEGTIPKGEYGGGTVMLWDIGTWQPLIDAEKGLQEGMLKFTLHGKRLQGKWALIQMKNSEDTDNWLLVKEKDEFSLEQTGIENFNTSVKTGRSMAEIEKDGEENSKKNPFNKVSPQLASLASILPEGQEWVYEVKYDGYRILAFIENGNVKLTTRNSLDYTKKFLTVSESLKSAFPDRALVLDGEIVVADKEGRTDFQALQSYIKNPKGKTLTYILFDLLALDGKDYRGKTLSERKAKLEEILVKAPQNLCYSEHFSDEGKEVLVAACRAKLEGIVAKRTDGVYREGRNNSWLKVKCRLRQEFVIGGYTRTAKKENGISALLLGYYHSGELLYAGRAGTGIGRREERELLCSFSAVPTSPFKGGKLKGGYNEKLFYISPDLVAEIEFAEWTGENLLRQASYKGLRKDKDAKEVILERENMAILRENNQEKKTKEQKSAPESTKKIDSGSGAAAEAKYTGADKSAKKRQSVADNKSAGDSTKKSQSVADNKSAGDNGATQGKAVISGVTISSPDKAMYLSPAVSKWDVASYYEKVAEKMLPYLDKRILSTVRCPKGVGEDCFYRKHPNSASKDVVEVDVRSSDGEVSKYFYVDSVRGIIDEVQNGTVEFHIWGSRANSLEKPDVMVFDLDPDEGMDIDKVREGVIDLKSLLDELSLTSFLKTSGGKGYHILVPFLPSPSWEVFNSFAKNIAVIMEKKWPKKYTSNMRKIERSGKIFVDWVRNGRGATSVAPYSLRAKEGAKVSMPISFEELFFVAPQDIDIFGALKRLKEKDPWENFFSLKQELT